MPLKPIYSRYPLLAIHHSFLSNGQIRTTDERISRLYESASSFDEQPSLWEGLFQLACLLKDEPEKEPAALKISAALKETESGSFAGSPDEQISVARAALELFGYNTDRQILKRLSEWCRYLEVEWDTLTQQSLFLCRPAELMEFLVRFYRCSGIKSVLRLCAKLRSSAFDWTTALQTFHQHVPLAGPREPDPALLFTGDPGALDYDRKQLLINHAESLADGFRYCVFSGLFSGNGQDLTAGETAWEYLRSHHRAVCGGTTADPLLSGRGTDRATDTRALAAWTEAFAAHLATDRSEWAADELIRIIHNGLSYCLESPQSVTRQRVNTLAEENGGDDDPSGALARLCRAAASAYRFAVTLTEDGFRINYLLSGRYILMIRNQPVVVKTEPDKAVFQCREPFSACVDLYCPPTETGRPYADRGGRETALPEASDGRNEGYYIRTSGEWKQQEGFRFRREGRVFCEQTHHQGLCVFERNSLMCLDAKNGDYAYAVCGLPEPAEDGGVKIPVARIERWNLHGVVPADIPVLPEPAGEPVSVNLRPYPLTRGRITVFPRVKEHV